VSKKAKTTKKIDPALSALTDEEPKTLPVVETTRTPVLMTEDGDEKGETATPVLRPDGRRVGMPTKIHTVLTPEQQLRKAMCKQKPCAACQHAEFPRPESPHYIEIESMLRACQKPRSQQGRSIWLGLTVHDFVWCDADPLIEIKDENGVVIGKNGGPGGKFLQHNCAEWKRRQEDLYPDWVPRAYVKLAEVLTTISDRLRARGVRGFLAAMKADLLRRRHGGNR
jgi:hypothetical protein